MNFSNSRQVLDCASPLALGPRRSSRLSAEGPAQSPARAGLPPLRFLWFLLFTSLSLSVFSADNLLLLKPAAFSHYVEHFNAMEDENVTNFISNARSGDWLAENIPLFECPDREVEEMYYFRWWSFRKHIVQTTNGFVITEFLTPVRHAGVFNTISCAAGFHVAEGRWLRDPRYLDDYIRFWLRGHEGMAQPHFHKYSSWFASAVYDRSFVTGDRKFVTGLLDDFIGDFAAWESERKSTNGLFWQYDVRDGMEESISGSRTNKNLRPTINTYMFANARAIAEIARMAGKDDLAAEYADCAKRLKDAVQATLWDPDAKFFKVRLDNGRLSDAREEIGFIPWMFELPDSGKNYESAWAQLTDPKGFQAPFGITTAERRHPKFRSHGVGTCEWDGAVWPFATSQTLVALANVLQQGPGDGSRFTNHVSRSNYFDAFLTYVHSQHANGKPCIGEYLDEVTGQWINGSNGRSRYYNHSTFADLLITGVIGLRPRADETVEMQPLLPADTWDWFGLDGVKYHGRTLTILWDKTGQHYQRGSGLRVWVDGKQVAHSATLEKVEGRLP